MDTIIDSVTDAKKKKKEWTLCGATTLLEKERDGYAKLKNFIPAMQRHTSTSFCAFAEILHLAGLGTM